MTSFTKLTSAHAAAPRTLTAAPLWRRSPAAELPRPPSPSTFIPSSSAPPSFSSHLLLHLPNLTTTNGGPPPTYPKTNFYPLSSNWLFPLLLPEVPLVLADILPTSDHRVLSCGNCLTALPPLASLLNCLHRHSLHHPPKLLLPFFLPLSTFPIKSIHQSRSRTKVQLLASFSGILTQRPAVTFAFRLKFNLSSTVSVSITIMSSITSHRCVLFCKTASMPVEDLFSRLLLARRASAMMVWFLSLAAKRSSHLVIAVIVQKLTMPPFLTQ